MSVIGAGSPLEHNERLRMRAAAYRVRRVYPGAAGEVLAKEINAWDEFGYRLGDNSLINRLIDQVLTAVIPVETPPIPAQRSGSVTGS